MIGYIAICIRGRRGVHSFLSSSCVKTVACPFLRYCDSTGLPAIVTMVARLHILHARGPAYRFFMLEQTENNQPRWRKRTGPKLLVSRRPHPVRFYLLTATRHRQHAHDLVQGCRTAMERLLWVGSNKVIRRPISLHHISLSLGLCLVIAANVGNTSLSLSLSLTK
jgi:hypothetical protein